MSGLVISSDSICEIVDQPLALVNTKNELVQSNRAFRELFDESGKVTAGKNIFTLPDGHWNGPELARILSRDDFDSHQILTTPEVDSTLGALTGSRRVSVSVSQANDVAENSDPLLLVAIRQTVPAEGIRGNIEKAECIRAVCKNSASESQVKGRFLTSISHELRTPMTAILGMLELSLQQKLPSPVREYLMTAHDSGEVLLSLLNDILDFAKLEFDRFTFEFKPFDLREVLNKAVTPRARLAKKRGLNWTFDVQDSVPDYLVGDAARLRQIVDDLLDNAIKYTHAGEIRFQVSLEQRNENNSVILKFVVSDTGPGMSEKNQREVLEGFTQADSSFSRPHGGAGLGLAISQAMVNRLDGHFSISSTLGKGCNIEFTIPFRESLLGESDSNAWTTIAGNSKHETGSQSMAQQTLSILLAEDTPANQKVIKSVLHKRGHQVTIASNGKEAVNQVAGNSFDAILMDLQMPVMDGYQATAVIREQEQESGTHTPIIALTAHSAEEDRQLCLRSGMDDYLEKPINIKQLVTVVESIAQPAASRRNLVQSGQTEVATSAHTPALDLETIMDRLGGDKDLFQQFIEVYLEESPKLLEALRKGLAEEDSEQVVRSAHSLRGLAANFNAGSVVELAASLEASGKDRNFSEARMLLDDLAAAVTAFSQLLEQYR